MTTGRQLGGVLAVSQAPFDDQEHIDYPTLMRELDRLTEERDGGASSFSMYTPKRGIVFLPAAVEPTPSSADQCRADIFVGQTLLAPSHPAATQDPIIAPAPRL